MYMYCTYTLHNCYITVGYGTTEHNWFGDRRARVVRVRIPGKGLTVIWDGTKGFQQLVIIFWFYVSTMVVKIAQAIIDLYITLKTDTI